MTDLIVRPFQASDRESVFRIGADTAYFGAPVEAYMEDRNIFLDGFYAYYIDLEPDHAWVASANGEVVGFITGCVDSRSQGRKYARFILPRLMINLFRGKYHFGRHSLEYFWGLLSGFVRHEFAHVDWNVYPAHLHINVDAAWRGHKLGQRLMQAYLDHLRNLRVKGVYLDTTSLNETACRMYEKFGFRILDSRPVRFWSRRFNKPVYNLCYGLLLGSDQK
jgi:ribosomal protein S18 acetylase RimI-like enzyme